MNAFKTRVVRICLLLGVVAVLAVMGSPTHLHALNPGPMTVGHESVACTACHSPANGTVRQQIQANLRYLFGTRATAVAFGFKAPGDSDCIACHARPNDPHSVGRFAEPRFADVLKTVPADSCLGCHREHRGMRVSSGADFCAGCHADLSLKNDPLDVSHATLVAQRRWAACMGCHDYHGNHPRRAQERVVDAYDLETIASYLASGPDPYGDRKRHSAPVSREK